MKKIKNAVPVTKIHIDQLHEAQALTGCGAPKFLRWVENAPKGLSSTTIYNWMHGVTQIADEELLDFVLANWPKMPKLIEITEELIAKLKAEQIRTGIGGTRLIKTMDQVPSGLKAIMISNWKSGRADKAREDHVDAVLKAYEAIQ